MTVHSVLPDALTAAVGEVLDGAGVRHVAHGEADPVAAAVAAARDSAALAIIGPYRSADVAEAVEVSAPAGLPLLAPVATWAGVTRDDEPGCEDAARHRGTVLRPVARDTVVAQRLSRLLSGTGRRALVVAGDHEYGRQLDGQLRLADLPRAADAAAADVVVLAGLEDGPEIRRAAELAPLPALAFDGVLGGQLGAGREVRLALPFPPGIDQAGRAAEMVVTALEGGARERATLLAELRRLGPFDDHGDPIDPPVWLWRARDDWTLEPDEAI